jgi:mRNA-degrading endonuclease RelE of RelBE toxin-antitoxin system
MSFSVNVTPRFETELKRLARKYPSLKKEFPELVKSLKENPVQGSNLGHHCYKIRLGISSKGKGKSGGARVITYIKVQASTVYLLTIFDKSEAETISDKDLAALLATIK